MTSKFCASKYAFSGLSLCLSSFTNLSTCHTKRILDKISGMISGMISVTISVVISVVISGRISGTILAYLVPVPVLDLTVLIEVL